MRGLRRLYRPILDAALAHRVATLAAAVSCSPARCSLARGIGSEFMPPLNEGDLMFMPIADPSISLEENTRIAQTPERRAPSGCRKWRVSSPRLAAPRRPPTRRP